VDRQQEVAAQREKKLQERLDDSVSALHTLIFWSGGKKKQSFRVLRLLPDYVPHLTGVVVTATFQLCGVLPQALRDKMDMLAAGGSHSSA
jgi:hypothetical protein